MIFRWRSHRLVVLPRLLFSIFHRKRRTWRDSPLKFSPLWRSSDLIARATERARWDNVPLMLRRLSSGSSPAGKDRSLIFILLRWKAGRDRPFYRMSSKCLKLRKLSPPMRAVPFRALFAHSELSAPRSPRWSSLLCDFTHSASRFRCEL